MQGSGISLFREATHGDSALSTNCEGKSDRPSRTDYSCRATNAKSSIKDDGVSNEIFQLEKTDDRQSALLPERKLGSLHTTKTAGLSHAREHGELYYGVA